MAAAHMEIDGLRVRLGRSGSGFQIDVEELILEAGKLKVILGANGTGKSTTMDVISGVRSPHGSPDFTFSCRRFDVTCAAGSWTFYRALGSPGEEYVLPARIRERLRCHHIGLCIQNGQLVPSLTLLENVALPSLLAGQKGPYDRAYTLLDCMGLAELAGHLPLQLSGGQKQRGILARTLVHDPDFVILDEPTANVPRSTARDALAYLREGARSFGRAVLMVTHDPVLAEEFADEILEMEMVGRASSRLRAPVAHGGRHE